MRSGKMAKYRKENLACLLKEIKSPRIAYRALNYYQVSFCFHDENEAEIFRKLLLFNMGFLESRVKLNKSTMFKLDRTVYVVDVTWHKDEREILIETIEEYLQEDNMGPTNIDRENTKFYAIVADERGKETAYEITHLSLESRMECCFGESTITHRVEFDQDRLVPCNCTFAEWAKQKDELEKLRAENEKLKTRLGNCENQLRNACEFLNGYGDVHIDIPTELKNLDYFSSIVNYTTNGETNRRDFGREVAEQVKRRAEWHNVWRKPENPIRKKEDDNILEDAVEAAMNPFYISSGCMKTDHVKADSVDALSYSALLCRDLRLKLNSAYGITAVRLEEDDPKIDIYNKIKDVKFANPATIVFWKDGTKTVVKAQGDEQYVPEVGLAMCICKKVMGNTRDYYRVFKHWMKKV